jgi:hypothetical protein
LFNWGDIPAIQEQRERGEREGERREPEETKRLLREALLGSAAAQAKLIPDEQRYPPPPSFIGNKQRESDSETDARGGAGVRGREGREEREREERGERDTRDLQDHLQHLSAPFSEKQMAAAAGSWQPFSRREGGAREMKMEGVRFGKAAGVEEEEDSFDAAD